MSANEEDAATRDALNRYVTEGSDLSKPMEIDFFISVPSLEAAEAVAAKASELGFSTRTERDESGDELVQLWTCYCTMTLVPIFERVRQIERSLDVIARPFGGHADGFGSYGNADAIRPS